MSNHSIIYVGNSMELIADAVQDSAGALLNDATVTLESLTAEAGASVSGITYPLSMVYAGASPNDGKYKAILPDDLDVVAERWYVGVIKVVSSEGLVGRITERFRAQVRRA